MRWIHYRLCFQLLSPLHVGYRKVGNLMETRPYVPGKALWGALTARITRDFHNGSQPDEYIRIGDQIRKHFRLGYLWPSLDGRNPYFPWEHEDWDHLLRGSYVGTPLDYDRNAAEMGGLHETEFIAPRSRNGRPVYLIGDLWVDDQANSLGDWRQALGRLQLGGERTYGWGRVRLIGDLTAGTTGSGTTAFGQHWKDEAGEVILTVPAGEHLTAHALAEEPARSGVRGLIEPFFGRETRGQSGFGGHLPGKVLICWQPGSQVTRQMQVIVEPEGILRAI